MSLSSATLLPAAIMEDDDEEEEDQETATTIIKKKMPVAVVSAAEAASTASTKKAADLILAEAMYQLSVEERNLLYEDIHGVSGSQYHDEFERNSAHMHQLLEDMKKELRTRMTKHNTGDNNGGGGGDVGGTGSRNGDDEEKEEGKERSSTEEEPATAATTAASKAKACSSNKQLPAFVLAMKQNEEYVLSLRLMFLRAEFYNVKAAVTRMIGFLDFKKELFGVNKLCGDITLKDFNSDDLDYFHRGYHQLLPGTDSSGRSVVLFHRGNTVEEQNYFDEIPINSILRVNMHMMMHMVTDKHNGDYTQKAGFVVVSYDCSNHVKSTTFKYGSQAYIWRVSQLINVLPMHLRCDHYLYDDPKMELLLMIARTALGPKMRVRLRGHYVKSYVEGMYKLLQFGISPDILPLGKRSFLASSSSSSSPEDVEGFVTAYHHKIYCERIKRLEGELELEKNASLKAAAGTRLLPQQQQVQQKANGASHITPNDNDLLLGRGGYTRTQHPGNLRLQCLLDQYQSKYENGNRFDKTIIAEIILEAFKENTGDDGPGGRFLRLDTKTGEWQEVDDRVARQRIGHGFRNRRIRRSAGGGNKNNSTGNGRDNSTSNSYSSSNNNATNINNDHYHLGNGGTHVSAVPNINMNMDGDAFSGNSILSSSYGGAGGGNNGGGFNCFNNCTMPCISGNNAGSNVTDGDIGNGGRSINGGIFMNFNNKQPKMYHQPM